MMAERCQIVGQMIFEELEDSVLFPDYSLTKRELENEFIEWLDAALWYWLVREGP